MNKFLDVWATARVGEVSGGVTAPGKTPTNHEMSTVAVVEDGLCIRTLAHTNPDNCIVACGLSTAATHTLFGRKVA